MRILLRFCWVFFPTFCFTQNLQKADSLFQEEVYEEAVILYRAIINHPKNLTDSLKAKIYHKLGVSQYYLYEDQAAIESWKESLEIRKKILSKSDISLLKNYRNLGNAYINTHQLELAKEQFQIAWQFNPKNSLADSILLCETFKELGYIFSKQKDLINAETYLKIAVDLGQNIYQERPWELADIHNLLVIIYDEYSLPEKMIEHAEKGILIYENLESKYEEDYIGLAHFYNNLGVAYDYKEAFSKAIDYYEKSLAINQKYLKNKSNSIARNYNNLAVLYNKIGRKKLASTYLDKAIQLGNKDNDKTILAANYNTKGEIYLQQKQFQNALKNYQKGITYLVADYHPKSIHELPSVSNSVIANKPFLIQDLFDKAKAYQAIAKETEPIQNLKYSLQTIDSISVLINLVRNSFESDASKQFLTTQAKEIFEKAITICSELAHLTADKGTYFRKALDYAERSKSIILLEAVKQSGAKTMAGIPANLLQREQVLKKRIADIEEQIFTFAEEENLATLRIDLSQKQQQLATLVDTFETQYSAYFQLKYAVETIDLNTLQQNLSDESAMIEYFVGKENAYWFYVDKQQIKMDTIGQLANLSARIKAFRTSIFAPFTQRGLSQDSLQRTYVELGQALYQQLVAPALQEETTKNIRIIPDGILGYLPFDALLTDTLKTAVGNYKNYPFLQRTHRLCYSYSLALLTEKQQQQKQTTQKEILGVAPIFNPKYPLQLGQTNIQLAPLLANVKTTEKLLSQYQGIALLKEAAQKETFLQVAPNYAYLHLASHAQMNDENGDYSFISFAQTSDTVQQENLLFVRELYNVPLKAEMVVLSACETALGELQEGEGIISLARAFAYAGANSIITTLWQVSDQKSAELVTAFYQFLAEGNTKDAALWQAKNRLIEQGFTAHPYYWAGFIPIGEMRAIELERRTDWRVWILGGLLLSGLLIGVLFLTRKDTV